LYPETEPDVLGFQDKSTMCWIVPPEPLAVSTADVELLVKKEMLAEAAPAAVGANVTLKGTLWPLGIVTGRESPAKVKRELFELAEDTITFPPLAVRLPL
jgi:hypothetical protein